MPAVLAIYDTASHQLRTWKPGRDVRIYVCGITPYDSAHLGHILTFMTYDILQRFLEDQGHRVTLVRNITDVDEPIYRRARQLHIPYDELAARETKSFHEVLERLGFRTPAHEPRASQYIEEMAAAVSQLLASGVAYRVDQDIYFDTSRDAAFGSLSGFSDRLKLGLMKNRGGDPHRAGKRQPLDFLLWRAVSDPADPAAWEPASKPALPRGRPGWHIECSVMSSELLGGSGSLPFDLHGGGSDLIFPHHECEAAQTRALYDGAQLATHWMHVAALDYCGEKMSKSLGNLVFARDLLEHHEPAAIRLALLNYHYRIGGEWLPCLLHEAADLLQALRSRLAGGSISSAEAAEFAVAIRRALADDLDTHAIMHLLQELAIDSSETKSSSPVSAAPATSADLAAIYRTLELIGLSIAPATR